MKLYEVFSRTSSYDYVKPRKPLPWISGPVDHKAAKAHNGTHEETKMHTQEKVIEFDETRLHHTDADAPMFKHHHEATSIELFYDLYFVANLATFTANQEVDTSGTLWSYVGFFTLMWFTWLQTSLFDVRFAADSFYQRACKLISFGVFTGFAIVGPIFNTSATFHDAKAFKAMSLILMVSRLALAVQYSVVLWYVRGYKKVFMPLLLHVGILFISAMAFLGLAFSFKYKMKDGQVVYKDGLQKATAESQSFVGWYVVVIVEAIAVIVVSSFWRVVSFKHTSLVERVGLLTLIVIGEGIIGMTKSVTYVSKYAINTSGATIGVVVAAVSLIYLLWVLYFGQIEHDRFGTIRQQIWAILHYPLHVAIVLTVEGSTQLITWWIALENIMRLDDSFGILDKDYSANTTIFLDALNKTMLGFDLRFKKEIIPDFTFQYEAISNLDITVPAEKDQILLNVYEISNAITNWVFALFGFKGSGDLQKNAEDDFGHVDAILNAYSTIFVFFLIAAGSVLMILGVLAWIGKSHKTRGEVGSGFVRVLGGLALALVTTSYYTSAAVKLLVSPWMIPLVVLFYLAVLFVDNIIIRLSNRRLATRSNQTSLAQSDEP